MEDDAPSRLRSAASYKKFHPQALACSPPTFLPDGQSAQSASAGDDFSSLGATSGDDGIALFRTSRPDVPLLVLSHSSMVGSHSRATGGIQNLAFEPTLTDSVLLAASRGNGLLIWDASGHSLSPLMGRLALDSTETSSTSSHDICSMAWKSAAAQPMIATATAAYTCLWDLRSSLGAKTSKPSLRFGSLNNTLALIQVAFSHKEECATMDSSGLVRVYDLRMTGGAKPKTLTIFPSFHFAGVGLASFRTSADDSYWMTWGLDAPKADAIVKIWSTAPTNTQTDLGETDSDTYWHMDGSADRTRSESISLLKTGTQMAQFTMPYLACARVCPAPFENSVVTVGLTKGGGSGWKAELWKLSVEDDEASENTDTFGVEKMVSFSGDRNFDFGVDNPIGPLRGAELALSQSPLPITRAQQRETGLATRDDWELLLCCMSQDGLVTTSVVAEAPSTRMTKASSQSGGPRLASRSLRYIPNERRGNSTLDAASALKSIGDFGHGRNSMDDSRHAYAHNNDAQNAPPSPDKTTNKSMDGEQSKNASTHRGEGSTMPFDMDVGFAPVIIEQAGLGPSAVVSDEAESTGVELSIQQSRVTKHVATDRVPCPRLCGATFSPGIGGLVSFDNGEIRTMWAWYKNNESRRKSSGLRSSSDTVKENSNYPRLKKDLDDMTKAAKDAQWGENSEDRLAGDSDSEGSIDDLFEDSSSEEGDMDSLAPGEQEEAEKSHDIYQTYFGSQQKPIGFPNTTAKNSTEGEVTTGMVVDDVALAAQERQRRLASFDGPTSEVLAPVVRISFDTNAKMFNGQTVELAENLLLGDWNVIAKFAKLDDASTHGTVPSSPTGAPFDIGLWSPIRGKTMVGATNIPRASTTGGISLVHSDPSIHMPSRTNQAPAPSLARDDEFVHDGEYTTRPRREESMLILRKLLPTPYQSLLSPPDSHLLPNKLESAVSPMKRSASSGAIMQTAMQAVRASLVAPPGTPAEAASGNIFNKPKVGVFTMPTQRTAAFRATSDSLLKLICIHNSNVCRDYGQNEKADTWSMIAHAAENHLHDDGNDSFSGWGSAAIGRELVASLLKYYETEGDVQMVASMICVLNTDQSSDNNSQRTVSLLSPDQNDKYDLYIQRYAELVFRWGLLTKRVELHKHLSRHLPVTDGVQLLPTSSATNHRNDEIDDNDVIPTRSGISFGGSCQRCHATITTHASNICSSCHDYAFRCIMCDNAVRGLFTVCSLCGHGGHLNHVMSWFEGQTKCPSGCGCVCVLTSSGEHASRADEPELLPVQGNKSNIVRFEPSAAW